MARRQGWDITDPLWDPRLYLPFHRSVRLLQRLRPPGESVLGGLDIIALVIVDALKGRVRMIAIAFALLPFGILALLAVNAGDLAEESPSWLLALVGTPLMAAFYLMLLIPAFRLGKPTSRWAQKYYGDEKMTRATERFGGPKGTNQDPQRVRPVSSLM